MLFNRFIYASTAFLLGFASFSVAEEQTCDSKSDRTQQCANPPKKNVLIVVDMENSYCSKEACPEFDPTVDGEEYTFAPPSWRGPGCGSSCSNDDNCKQNAIDGIMGEGRILKQTVPTWEDAVAANRKCVDGKCACDSVPSEATLISNIAKIVEAKSKETGKSIWDAIVFTHDWNAYRAHKCAENATSCDLSSQSLVAWTKGSEIVEGIAEAVDKAFPPQKNAITLSNKVFHFVKQKANWGLARHQDMHYRFKEQGQYFPLYLKESILGTDKTLFDPGDVQLTVVGSYTQYCVLAGVLQTMLSGYNNIIIPKYATGGYDDSQATPLAGSSECPNGILFGTDGNHWKSGRGHTVNCPKPIPQNGAPIVEFTKWMADTAGGEGDIYHKNPAFQAELAFSAQNFQTTKDQALDWMKQLGAEVPEDWVAYVDLLASKGIVVD